MGRGRRAVLIPWIGIIVSGAAGLVYEVVWSRAMATLFGSVLPATGVLLALFMGGMGLGAVLGGRWAVRSRNPLAAFGAVELGVGTLALATPRLLHAAVPLVARVDVHLPDALAPLVPAAVSVVVLVPVVVLLGTTFPLFVAWATSAGDGVAELTGRVYGLNTLGAAAGTVTAGFFLLPWAGITRSLEIGAVADLLVGAACLAASRVVGTRARGDDGDKAGEERSRRAPLEGLAVRVALLGGAAALVLEVAWFRALTLVFGSSVHALSLMLTSFLLGLVCGALVLARRGDSAADQVGLLARLHLLTAFAATLVTVLLQVVPALYIPVLRASGGAFEVVAGGTLLILLGVLVVPTTLMGASLPLAIRIGTEEDGRPSGPAGRVYGASSIGSSAGALAAGFLLVPVGGLRVACLVGVALSLAAAAFLIPHATARSSRRQGWQVATLVAVLWGVWLAGLMPWDWRILTAGYYAYGHLYSDHRATAEGPVEREVVLEEDLPLPAADPGSLGWEVGRSGPGARERLLSWEEGTFAQVAVVEQGGIRSLLINGKADASNGIGDMRTQLLLGHLPALLSPARPGGEALVVGLGSGVTAGAVRQWPFSVITVAEIEPAVIRASRWFTRENGEVLADPRVTVRADDARHVLARFPGELQMITSEPSNLWMSGVSLLFTREFFTLAADRLGAGGVLCQWLHLYQVGEEDVRAFLGTLADVFPHLLVFVDGSDMLVVAASAPLTLDPVTWQRRLASRPQVGAALARVGIRTAAHLARGLVVDERGVRAWSAGAPRHTDDRPILEFTAARHMAADYSARIRSDLVRAGVAAGQIRLGSSGAVAGPSTLSAPEH